MSSQTTACTRILTVSRCELAVRFGGPGFSGAVHGYTQEADTHAALALLTRARLRRVLEIGAALGHMTANFTRWTLDDGVIFSLGIVQGTERAAAGAPQQDWATSSSGSPSPI